jgi:hypothetical protein
MSILLKEQGVSSKHEYPYIEFNEDRTDFKVMMPYIRASNGVSLDNTCSAIRAFREALGYNSQGIGTGYHSKERGIYKSLTRIIADNINTSNLKVVLRAQQYKNYLDVYLETFSRITNYGNRFHKLTTDNSNIITLNLQPRYSHAPHVAPVDTIIYHGLKIYRQHEFKPRENGFYKYLYSDKKVKLENLITNSKKYNQEDFIIELFKDEKHAEIESSTKEDRANSFKEILNKIINHHNVKTKKLIDPKYVASINGCVHKNLNTPLWTYESLKATSRVLNRLTGNLDPKEIIEQIIKIDESELLALLNYHDHTILMNEENDKKEIASSIISILDINTNFSKRDELMEQILYSDLDMETKKEEADILMQFILGMVYAHVFIKNKTALKRLGCYPKSFYIAIDQYHQNNKDCMITIITDWANEYFKLELTQGEKEEIKNSITAKWETLTGYTYKNGKTPEGGDKIPYWDQLIILNKNNQSSFKEYNFAFSMEMMQFGKLQFDIDKHYEEISEEKKERFHMNIERINFKYNIFFISIAVLTIMYIILQERILDVITYSFLGQLPLIYSLPILQIIAISQITTYAIDIICWGYNEDNPGIIEIKECSDNNKNSDISKANETLDKYQNNNTPPIKLSEKILENIIKK